MKPLVLLIDDDRLPMMFYIRALEKEGFEVKQFTKPDPAIDFLRNDKGLSKVVVLDIMLPPGEILSRADTNGGLKTGILLYDLIKKIRPDLPIVPLTNVTNQKACQELTRIGVKVYQKTDYPPFQLVGLIRQTMLK